MCSTLEEEGIGGSGRTPLEGDTGCEKDGKDGVTDPRVSCLDYSTVMKGSQLCPRVTQTPD